MRRPETLIARGLPYGMERCDISRFFPKCRGVKIHYDRDSGNSTGTAFIEFDTVQDMREALDSHRKGRMVFKGRSFRLEHCHPKRVDISALREQLEYALSNENLQRDPLFQELITKDGEGWIHFDDLQQCHKIKRLGAYDEDVQLALRASNDLEVRGCYVRRLSPFALDESTDCRRVCTLPEGSCPKASESRASMVPSRFDTCTSVYSMETSWARRASPCDEVTSSHYGRTSREASPVSQCRREDIPRGRPLTPLLPRGKNRAANSGAVKGEMGSTHGENKGSATDNAKGEGKDRSKGEDKGEGKGGKGNTKGGDDGTWKGNTKGEDNGESKGNTNGGDEGTWKGNTKGENKGESKGNTKGGDEGTWKGNTKGENKGESKGNTKGGDEGTWKGNTKGEDNGESKGNTKGGDEGTWKGNTKGEDNGESKGNTKGWDEGTWKGNTKGKHNGEGNGNTKGGDEGTWKGNTKGEDKGEGKGSVTGENKGEGKGSVKGEHKGPGKDSTKDENAGEGKGNVKGENKGPGKDSTKDENTGEGKGSKKSEDKGLGKDSMKYEDKGPGKGSMKGEDKGPENGSMNGESKSSEKGSMKREKGVDTSSEKGFGKGSSEGNSKGKDGNKGEKKGWGSVSNVVEGKGWVSESTYCEKGRRVNESTQGEEIGEHYSSTSAGKGPGKGNCQGTECIAREEKGGGRGVEKCSDRGSEESMGHAKSGGAQKGGKWSSTAATQDVGKGTDENGRTPKGANHREHMDGVEKAPPKESQKDAESTQSGKSASDSANEEKKWDKSAQAQAQASVPHATTKDAYGTKHCTQQNGVATVIDENTWSKEKTVETQRSDDSTDRWNDGTRNNNWNNDQWDSNNWNADDTVHANWGDKLHPTTQRKQWTNATPTPLAQWTDAAPTTPSAEWTNEAANTASARWTNVAPNTPSAHWAKESANAPSARWTNRAADAASENWTNAAVNTPFAQWTKESSNAPSAHWANAAPNASSAQWNGEAAHAPSAYWTNAAPHTPSAHWASAAPNTPPEECIPAASTKQPERTVTETAAQVDARPVPPACAKPMLAMNRSAGGHERDVANMNARADAAAPVVAADFKCREEYAPVAKDVDADNLSEAISLKLKVGLTYACRGLYDGRTECGEGFLTLQEDDRVKVHMVENGWAFCEKLDDGALGYFPPDFLYA